MKKISFANSREDSEQHSEEYIINIEKLEIPELPENLNNVIMTPSNSTNRNLNEDNPLIKKPKFKPEEENSPSSKKFFRKSMNSPSNQSEEHSIRRRRRDVKKRVSIISTATKSNVNNLIHLNLYFSQFSISTAHINQLSPAHSSIDEDVKKFKNGTFSWKKIKDLKIREKLLILYSQLGNVKGLNLLEVKPFMKVFKLKTIKQYLQSNFFQLNYKQYDFALRFCSMITGGLLNFYLKYDLRFWSKCSSIDSQSLDPFHRQALRNKIRRSRTIQEKYVESPEFNLKKLVAFLIKEYPQIIANNRLSTGITILSKIFNILALTLEFGFWHVSEIIPIINILNLNVSSMIKIEEMVNELNIQLEKTEAKTISKSLRDCRRYLTISLIQVKNILNLKKKVMIQTNDNFFLKKFHGYNSDYSPDITNPGKFLKFFTFDNEISTEEWTGKQVYFECKTLMKASTGIILNYLLRDNSILGKKMIQSKEKIYLTKLMNLVFHVDRDPFVLSLEYITKQDISLYNEDSSENENAKKTEEKTNEAVDELCKFIDDVSKGVYGNSILSSNPNFISCFEGIIDKLMYLVSSPETSTLKNRLILCQRKAPQLLVTLVDFISLDKSTNKVRSRYRRKSQDLLNYRASRNQNILAFGLSPTTSKIIEDSIKVIALIGKGLDQVHVEIFSDESWFHLVSYFDRKPIKFAQLLAALCRGSERLFHISPRFFDRILELFIKSLEAFCHLDQTTGKHDWTLYNKYGRYGFLAEEKKKNRDVDEEDVHNIYGNHGDTLKLPGEVMDRLMANFSGKKMMKFPTAIERKKDRNSMNSKSEEEFSASPKFVEEHNLVVSLFLLSNIVEDILDCIPEKWNRQAFDLKIGVLLSNYIINIILPAIKDTELINFHDVVFTLEDDPKFKISKNIRDSKHSNKSNMSKEALINADFGLGRSSFHKNGSKLDTEDRFIMDNINLLLALLRLFNKSTKEVYSQNLYLKMRKEVWYDKISQYDFLCDSFAGVVFRSEILNCHTNFLIFHFNHVISDRLHHTYTTSLRDFELPENYYQGEPQRMILKEIQILKRVNNTFKKIKKGVYQDQNFLAFTDYILEGPLKMVYKYIRGVFYVCNDENILGNFFDQIQEISKYLASEYDNIENMLKKKDTKRVISALYRSIVEFASKTIPISRRKLKKGESNLLKDQIDDFVFNNSLKAFKDEILKIEVSLKSLFKRFKGDYDPSKFFFKSEVNSKLKENMKYKSKNDRDYTSWFANENMEEITSKNFEFSFDSSTHYFNFQPKKTPGCCSKKKRKFSSIPNNKGELPLTIKNVNLFKSAYKGKKEKYLSSRKNLILKTLGYAGERSSDYLRLINFLCKDFEEMSVTLRYHNTKTSFWVNEEFMTKIEILDILIASSSGAKQFFFEWIQQKEISALMRGESGILSKIFFCFLQLLLISVHKTFFCHRWADYKTDFMTLRQFLKNMNENDFQPFKILFGRTYPFLSETSFNLERYSYVEIYSLQLERIVNMSKIWTNRLSIVKDTDKPEIFDSVADLLEGVNEFVTGPCEFNQERLFSPKKLEIWYSILFRDIRDIENSYYSIVNQVVNHLLCFTEGSNSRILLELAKLSPPSKLFNQMIDLVKSLYTLHKIAQDSKIKNLMKKVKKRKKSLKNFGNEKNGKRGRNNSESFEAALLSRTIQEHEKKVELKSLSEIKDFYLLNEKFSSHLILEISAKLYFLLKNIANRSESYKQFLIEKNAERNKHISNSTHSESILIHSFMDSITSSVEIINLRKNIPIVKEIKPNTKLPNKKLKQLTDEAINVLDIFTSKTNAILSNHESQKKRISFNNNSFKIPSKYLKIETGTHEGSLNEKPQHILCYFIKTPESFFLAKTTKDYFMGNANIESVNTILDEFCRTYQKFKIEMIFGYQRNKRSRFIHFLSNKDSFRVYIWFVWILGLIQNILIILFFDVEKKSETNFFISTKSKNWIYGINTAILGLSIIILLFWLMTKFRINLNSEWAGWLAEKGARPSRARHIIKLYIGKSILQERKFIGLLLHTLFSLLAYQNPFFITLHLLLILNLSRTMRNVMSSIIMHVDQLLLTFLFALIVIYAFAVLTAQFYKDDFNKDAIGDVVVCHNLLSCVMQMVDLGLRFGGGIADAMNLYELEDGKFVGKWLYNIFFFIFINVIFLNVVFGIIIDTFAELRDKQSERDYSLRNQCHVCGINRDTFERNGKDFDNHKEREHDLWKYLNYLLYLDKKNELDFDGNELHVWRNFIEGSTTWIPQNNTLFLDVEDDDTEGKMTREFVDKKVDDLREDFYGKIEKVEHRLNQKLDKILSIMYAKNATNEI